MKRFWFFDLDGTLADTDPDIRLAWKATLAELGLSCPSFDRDFVAGPPMDEMARKLFPDTYTDALFARIKKGFAFHYDHDGFPSTREYPGVLEAVRALRSAGARTFIVTNKRYLGATAMFRHFHWETAFEGFYAGDMYPTGKLRKPELLARVLRELKAKPEDSVLVGDTISDFEAARANGLPSIGVTWGYGKADELARADRLISRAEDLR